MPKRTATTGNALLGLLALRPSWSMWELATQLRRNMRFFWPRAESRVYDEAGALARAGLARQSKRMVGRRPRTTYAISAKGRRRLQRWLETPPKGTSLECEPLLRVFLGKLGTPEQIRVALDQVRMDAHSILDVGRIVGAEYLEERAPFQDHVEVRAFVHDFLSNHALMLLAWADRTESAIDAWSRQTQAAKNEAALERIRITLRLYPSARETPAQPSS